MLIMPLERSIHILLKYVGIVIDEKGRILIPKKVRDPLSLKAGIKVKLRMKFHSLLS